MGRSKGKQIAIEEAPQGKKRKTKAISTSRQPQEEEETSSEEERIPIPESSRLRHDRQKFLTMAKQQRYLEIQGREILAERKVDLQPGEYQEFQDELMRRKWQKITRPEEKYNEELIREFYANAFPLQRYTKRRFSWVRGKPIDYSRDTINAYLGNPITLGEDEKDEYSELIEKDEFDVEAMAAVLCIAGGQFEVSAKTHKPVILKRGNMNTLTQIWLSLFVSNICPGTHVSDLNVNKAKFLYAILTQVEIDLAKAIEEDIHHLVMTASHSKALAFPGLITGLLKSQGVVIPSQPLRSIRKPITADYIRINCLERGAQIPPPPRRQAPTSTTESRLLEKMTLIEQQNSTILQQNLSNHLAMLSLNNSFYLQHQQQYFGGPSFDWPNPEQFATLVQWPGGSPYFQRGLSIMKLLLKVALLFILKAMEKTLKRVWLIKEELVLKDLKLVEGKTLDSRRIEFDLIS